MGASVETLQKRVGYGGRKGASAARRLQRIDRTLCTDRVECQRYYSRMRKDKSVIMTKPSGKT